MLFYHDIEKRQWKATKAFQPACCWLVHAVTTKAHGRDPERQSVPTNGDGNLPRSSFDIFLAVAENYEAWNPDLWLFKKLFVDSQDDYVPITYVALKKKKKKKKTQMMLKKKSKFGTHWVPMSVVWIALRESQGEKNAFCLPLTASLSWRTESPICMWLLEKLSRERLSWCTFTFCIK